MIPKPRWPAALAACLTMLAACGGDDADAPQGAGPLPALDRSADVAGPDRNGDGIRDDIAAWIDGQALEPPRRQALRQLARALQAAMLVAPDDGDAVQAAAWLGTSAVACVMSRLPGGAAAVDELRKISANTRPRVQAYLAYSRALDGAVLALPQGDGCED